MENVILIQVDSIADLEPNANFLMLNTTTGEMLRGNPDDSTKPIKMLDEKTPTLYANQFMFL